MLNREMKLLEAEFKDEKTTKKRREEIIQRIGQLNDKMSEAMKKLDGENVGSFHDCLSLYRLSR